VGTSVLVVFGGRSSEHEISCMSARSVLWAIDRSRHDVTAVGITREGRWTLVDGVPPTRPGTLPSVAGTGDTVVLGRTADGPVLLRVADGRTDIVARVDVCFPVLHGPYGEDGTIQGLLASMGVPYVGADVASSAIAIDKRQMKHVFSARGLPQVAYEAVVRRAWDDDADAVIERLLANLPFPVFTKPARQGSSIGIRKCTNVDELHAGLEHAFGYDRVVLVEQGLEGVRELECGVLGNGRIDVTRPGETLHGGAGFYDFDAKYLEPVELRCPADVAPNVQERCMTFARDAFEAIGARGMARVDFFYVQRTGDLYVSEINTIPGLTPSSMFPPLWEAEGLGFTALIDRLLQLALEAAEAEKRFAP
jgi:D-alanine-D-alanine ligase